MSFCTKCGNQLEPGVRFCVRCGAPVSDQAEPAPRPDYSRAVAAKPVVSAKTKALGFVGMGLGIGGLIFAVLGILYTITFLSLEPAAGFGASVGFGVFSLPCGIVGKVLCGRSMEAGNESAACSVGGKLALASLIVSAVMLLLGFIALLASL